MRRLPVILLLSLAAALLSGAAATRAVADDASTQPTTRPALATTRSRGGGQAVLQPAIDALVKEIRQSLKENAPPPRLQSNYFLDHPLPEATVDMVLQALARPPRGDVRVQAYVQWQLLSALPDELDARSAAALRRLYLSAPAPLPRPAIDRREQQRLDRLAMHASAESESKLSTELAEQVAMTETNNRHILNYRDELFHRLPKTYDTLAAGFEDAMVRLKRGADAEAFSEEVVDAVRDWASEPRSAAELSAMNRLVLGIKNQASPEYYDAVEWKESSRRLEWHARQDDLNRGNQLDELADFLYEQMRPGRRAAHQDATRDDSRPAIGTD